MLRKLTPWRVYLLDYSALLGRDAYPPTSRRRKRRHEWLPHRGGTLGPFRCNWLTLELYFRSGHWHLITCEDGTQSIGVVYVVLDWMESVVDGLAERNARGTSENYPRIGEWASSPRPTRPSSAAGPANLITFRYSLVRHKDRSEHCKLIAM